MLSVRSEAQTCVWPSWCHCHSLYLVPTHPGSPGQRADKRMCVYTVYPQYFTGQMPFLSPNQQSQSTEGRCWVVGCWHGYVWSKVQTCIWPNWCYCHSLSLATAKSTLVLSFWYRLTPVVPEKGPLNGCVFVHCILNSKMKQQCTAGSATGWHSLHNGVI